MQFGPRVLDGLLRLELLQLAAAPGADVPLQLVTAVTAQGSSTLGLQVGQALPEILLVVGYLLGKKNSGQISYYLPCRI